MEPTLVELDTSCDQCLDEMHQRGINKSKMRKLVEATFGKEDLEGLKGLLASM